MQNKNLQPFPLPNEKIIYDILSKVHKICVFGMTNSNYNKTEHKLTKNALALFALKQLRQDATKNKIELHKKTEALTILNAAHSLDPNALELQDPRWRETYLFGLMLALQQYTYNYGYGNCEAMAEVVFIASVLQKDMTCDIRYIRFDNSLDPSVAEVNTVVLGNWPKPGCIVLCPWQDDSGKYYIWDGTLENIRPSLELGLGSNYPLDRIRCLFTILADDPHGDKRYIEDYLGKMGYEHWLSGKVRRTNLASIRNDFFNCANQATFFKKEGRLLGNYKNLMSWWATSKDNYNEVEKIKTNLKEDEVVKNIFRMPLI